LEEQIIETLTAIISFIYNNAITSGIIVAAIGGIIAGLVVERIKTKDKIKIHTNLESAKKILDRGYAIRAYKMLGYVIEKAKDDIPLSIEAYRVRAKAFMHPKENDLELALSDANDAISKNEKDGDSYIIRGMAYSLMNKHKQAIDDFSEAITRNAKQKAEAYLYRGIEHYILEEFESANNDLGKAIKLKPDYPEAFFYLGNTYYGKEKFVYAVKYYNKALKINPKDLMVLNNCGCAYAKLLDYKRAMKLYTKVLKIEQYYPMTIWNRGILHFDIGNYDRAIADYNFSLEAEYRYYEKLIKEWDIEENEDEDYKDSVKDDIFDAEESKKKANVLFSSGTAYARKGDYDRAISNYNQALEKAADDNYLTICILCNRANVYSMKNDLVRALEDFNAALEKAPDNSWLLNNRANIYFALGDYERSVTDYKKAIEKAPNDGVAKINLFYAEKMAEQKRLETKEKENGSQK